jgi:hypothetical protein
MENGNAEKQAKFKKIMARVGMVVGGLAALTAAGFFAYCAGFGDGYCEGYEDGFYDGMEDDWEVL